MCINWFPCIRAAKSDSGKKMQRLNLNWSRTIFWRMRFKRSRLFGVSTGGCKNGDWKKKNYCYDLVFSDLVYEIVIYNDNAFSIYWHSFVYHFSFTKCFIFARFHFQVVFIRYLPFCFSLFFFILLLLFWSGILTCYSLFWHPFPCPALRQVCSWQDHHQGPRQTPHQGS